MCWFRRKRRRADLSGTNLAEEFELLVDESTESIELTEHREHRETGE
jgi:hypothetical protein